MKDPLMRLAQKTNGGAANGDRNHPAPQGVNGGHSLDLADPCRTCATGKSGYRHDHKSLYRQLLAGLYDAVLITDPNGYVIDTNPRVEEFFRYKASETWDIMVGELIVGVNGPLLERVRKGLGEGRFILLDAKCVRKDGTTFAGEVSISSIELVNGGDLVFAVRNVDRRKNAWQKLKSRQHAWMNALAAGVIGDPDGLICGINRAALKLWGYAGEEDLIGKPIEKLWVDVETAARAVAAAQSGASWSGPMQAATRDGCAVQVQASFDSEVGACDGVAGIVCSALPQVSP
ncbi:MAG: PAS domain S-box protein [Lentisphaerae bacterium]|nr:PAS domain S-box protein [Lentisphaerota bacterium]